jgi:hypothetical protein
MRVYFEKPRTTVGWKGLINGSLVFPRLEYILMRFSLLLQPSVFHFDFDSPANPLNHTLVN